ncbi:hypothetical protein [Myxococcus eversor]|uniref:hypothetical protein n=1 Tax=Myxococcus eversor TaxID=2709661 RepID=UPI0013D0358F|nr:hypothetical protein [Myxococcus eversor]
MAAALCLLFVSSTSHAQQAVFTDASGKIETGIFYGSSARSSHPTLTIPVSGDWVVIGGGGYTDWQSHGGYGSHLTASFPDSNFSSWTVYSKDHMTNDPCIIYGYALAIRVQGLTRNQLLQHVRMTQAVSAYVSYPNTIAFVDTGYTLLGCGFNDVSFGLGNMAVDSYPFNNTGCYAEGKDHDAVSPGTMSSFAIGIRTSLPGVGNVVNAIQNSLSSYSSHPQASASVPFGYALSGGGADATYYGIGQLLWKNMPMVNGTWSAGSKDHLVLDPGYVRAYAIGVTVQ